MNPWILSSCFFLIFFILIAYIFRATLFMHEAELFSPSTPMVIVVAYFNGDLAWLRSSKYPVVLCGCKTNHKNCPQLKFDKAQEASAYLQFIVTNYHKLPIRLAFLHGHEDAWHQNRKKSLLEDIEESLSSSCDYYTLNSNWIDDRRKISNNPQFNKLHEVWDKMFRPILNKDCPQELLHDCCAQFVVTRARVMALPLSAYVHLLKYVEESSEPSFHGHDAYMLEYMWHVIFGQPDVNDQETYERTCYKMA